MPSETVKKVYEIIAKMIRSGKKRIYYAELIGKCGISPTYARELLRAYAIEHGFTWDKGYLFVD